MGYLFDEVRLHLRRLVSTCVGHLQLFVLLCQASHGSAAAEDIDDEEDRDEYDGRARNKVVATAEVSSLLFDDALFLVCVIDNGQFSGIAVFLPCDG